MEVIDGIELHIKVSGKVQLMNFSVDIGVSSPTRPWARQCPQ